MPKTPTNKGVLNDAKLCGSRFQDSTGSTLPAYALARLNLLHSLGGIGKRQKALLLQSGERQSVPASNARLFEDVFEMNLYCSRADPQLFSNVAILQSAFHTLHYLLLTRSQRRTIGACAPIAL